MAGEARKAAERIARILRVRIHNMDPKDKYTDPAPPDNDKWLRGVCASDAKLIEPELQSIIEQCAQIADKAQAKSEEEVREFRRLKLSGCAMQSQSEMSAFRTVAAAIRSIAQQDSANEGE